MLGYAFWKKLPLKAIFRAAKEFSQAVKFNFPQHEATVVTHAKNHKQPLKTSLLIAFRHLTHCETAEKPHFLLPQPAEDVPLPRL